MTQLGDLLKAVIQGSTDPYVIDSMVAQANFAEQGSALASGWASPGLTTTIENTTLVNGNGNVIIDNTGIKGYNNAILTYHLQTDGDFFIGSDISAANTISFSIFTNAQTYNGEELGAGDVLFGSNSTNYANLLWDRSAKSFLFRTGTTNRMTLNTNGYLDLTSGGYITGSNFRLGVDELQVWKVANQPTKDFAHIFSGFLEFDYEGDTYEQHSITWNRGDALAVDITYQGLGEIGFYRLGNDTTGTIETHPPSGYTQSGFSVLAYGGAAVSPIGTTGFDLLKTETESTITCHGVVKLEAASGVQFGTGNLVNEFSTDGTMAGNSDTAVPTEKAVVTYVAAHGGSGNLSRGWMGV
jgi:hypothetical protein